MRQLLLRGGTAIGVGVGLLVAGVLMAVAFVAVTRAAREDQTRFLRDPMRQGRARRAAVGALFSGRDHDDPEVRRSQEMIARSIASTGYAGAVPFLLWVGALACFARYADSDRPFFVVVAVLVGVQTVYQVGLIASALRYHRRHVET